MEGYLIYHLDDEIHEAECEDQPEGFPCICQQIKDRREGEMQDLEDWEEEIEE